MKIRRMTTALAVGTLALVGGVAAGPPEEAASENGCRGIQEAQGEEGGNGQTGGTPAQEVLEEVEQLIGGEDGCEGEPAASGGNGRP